MWCRTTSLSIPIRAYQATLPRKHDTYTDRYDDQALDSVRLQRIIAVWRIQLSRPGCEGGSQDWVTVGALCRLRSGERANPPRSLHLADPTQLPFAQLLVLAIEGKLPSGRANRLRRPTDGDVAD